MTNILDATTKVEPWLKGPMKATAIVVSSLWSQQARNMVVVVVVRLRQVGREDRFSVSGATHVPPEVSNLLLSTRPTIYPTPPHTLSFL